MIDPKVCLAEGIFQAHFRQTDKTRDTTCSGKGVLIMAIAVTMCKLFAALLLGYVLNKLGMLDEHTSKRLSAIIMNAVLPFLIISSVAGIDGGGSEVLLLFLAGVVCYLIFPLIGWLVARLIRVPEGLRGTYMCMVMFSNNAFMGYPVVSALFGSSAIFYTTIFHMMFNLMVFSLGMILIRKDAGVDGYMEEAPLRPKERIRVIRQVLNNGVIASVLALVIYFCHIPLPEMITETCSFIGNICMPLSMMVIGSSIAGYPLKDIFSEKRVYLVTVVRLALMPLLVYFIMKLFTDNGELIKVATITTGMPIASIVAMASTPYPEQGKASAIAVVFTTICSLVTIPIMCVLLGA